MSRYKAIDIARCFFYKNELAKNSEGAEDMTLLKLLKLLYYAEGSSLALGKGSLFSENIEAWEHGPVVPAVWRSQEDPYNLSFESEDIQKSLNNISEDDKALLNEVYDVFGQYSAWGLRNKTHEERPWIEATENGRVLNRTISRKTMEEYFKENYVSE